MNFGIVRCFYSCGWWRKPAYRQAGTNHGSYFTEHPHRQRKEVKDWQADRNNKQATIYWQFTNEKARLKLKRLYPTILT